MQCWDGRKASLLQSAVGQSIERLDVNHPPEISGDRASATILLGCTALEWIYCVFEFHDPVA